MYNNKSSKLLTYLLTYINEEGDVTILSRYSTDFKLRKSFTFSLEAEKDVLTKVNEVDLLIEAARIKGETISKIARDAIIEYLKKVVPNLNKVTLLDKYIENENYMGEEPTLADYLKADRQFVSKSTFSNCLLQESFRSLR